MKSYDELKSEMEAIQQHCKHADVRLSREI